jgi:reductive dehalogenase
MYYPILKQRMQRFLKALGYLGLDRDVNSSNVGTGALVGNGELCRISHLFYHGWGTAMRYNPTILTDLPLEPTHPIDFGGFRFCKDCKICGQTCLDINGLSPISMSDATYDVTGPWNRIGVKAYQFTWPYDYFCNFCQASCPWTNHGTSMIHDLVKITSATTGLFNGFFANMEGAFGYERHWEKTDMLGKWWDRKLTNDPYDVIWK